MSPNSDSSNNNIIQACCKKCTHSVATPCSKLIECINEGPLCHNDPHCKTLRNERINYNKRGGSGTLIMVGAATCGLANGARKVLEQIKTFIKNNQISASVMEVGCIGHCQREVFVDFILDNGPRISYCDIGPENTHELLNQIFIEKNLFNKFLYGQHAGLSESSPHQYAGIPLLSDSPFFIKQKKVVLENCGLIDPISLDAYLAHQGFIAASKVLNTMTSEEVCDFILDSKLKGRGGAGFLTGQKWKIANSKTNSQKYIICNADEGDPGAFMDRAVLESDPYKVIEGMIIAAYAIGANNGYIYCRAEYPLAIERLENAIKTCKQHGLLGDNILDSLFSLNIKIKKGAGAFVCGEETAILASIEGGRGMPRPRPPFPAEYGLHGKPTILNNVETLANVAPIIRNGVEWFKGLGSSASPGTKVFALSGALKNTGLVEIPIGRPLKEIVFEIGGGALPGHTIKAVQIGGPSGGLIPLDKLEVEIDYQNLQNLGAMMGSGGMVVMDETSCMVDVAKFFMDFIRNESCGKCTPCREGTTRLFEILENFTRRVVDDENKRIERFKGLMYLEELAETIKETSLCGLGQSAANPILSTIRYFKEEYLAHIFENRCPAGACQGLRVLKVEPAACIGCSVCKKVCSANAILGERKHPHVINIEKCIVCGACLEACPKSAIAMQV